MKKKTLSLVLALAVCLGLATPAFAAEAGATTIEDSAGYRCTLSQPVMEISETTVSNPQGKITAPVYQIPAGTIITPVCPEGTKGEDAGGIFYALTDEEGLKQAGDAVQNSGFSQAASFIVNYKIMTMVDGELVILGDLEGQDYDSGNPIQPLPEGEYLIGRDISWAYHTVGDGASGSSTTNVGKSSYFCVEIVSKNEDSTPDAPAYQVNNWAKDRVALAVEAGLAPEGLGNDYRVGITRAQFAAVTVKLYEAMSGQKAPAAAENPFTDTEEPVILQAADLGFVSGVGGGKFDPDAPVNREQAAVMLASVYTKLGGGIPAVDATAFGDDGEISGWARNAVDFMNSKEIVTGIGGNNFGPKGGASIEQALLISLKMFEALK